MSSPHEHVGADCSETLAITSQVIKHLGHLNS